MDQRPEYYLIEAARCMDRTDPHLPAYMEALSNVMGIEPPTSEDIAAIIQGFAMQPILCTFDLQDAIEWINEKFGTQFTING